MMQFLSALFGLFDKIAGYFKDQQFIDAGKAEKTVEAVQKVEENVQKAESAVSTPDPVRDDRLRSRFDRSRNSGK